MNSRFWFPAAAEAKRIAAQVLTTNPINVSTLGLMRDSASQRTMVSSSTPQARPNALVQDMCEEDADVEDDAEAAAVVDDEVAGEADIRLPPLSVILPVQPAFRRAWSAGSGF